MHGEPAIGRPARLDLAPLARLARLGLRWLWRPLARGRGLALLLVAALCLIRVWNPAPVEIVRLKAFDIMQGLLPVDAAPPVVSVIAIDEASLRELGQWPWSRKLLSELLAKLMQGGAAVVGFDILFAEPDRMSPATMAKELADLDPAVAAKLDALPTNDAVFARTLRASRAVLGRFGEVPTAAEDANYERKITVARIGPDPRPLLSAPGALLTNLRELERAATGLGYLSLPLEHDNLVRRVPAVVRVGDAILPTLSIEMLRVATGQSTIAVKSDSAGIKAMVVAGVEVPVDRHGRMWLRALRTKPERYISAADFLAGRHDPAKIVGRPVLLGATAAGLEDLRSTSLQSNLPGVEVHAHLIENILSQRHLLRPHVADGIELTTVALVGLLLIVVLPLVGARWTLLAVAAVGAGVVGACFYLLRAHLYLIDPSYPVLSAAAIYSFLVYASYVSEERQRLFIRGAFGQYLSPALVERLAQDPSSLKLGGDTRAMTFLFSDVRGFTTISEGFKSDPQGLTRLINRFLTPMTETIMARQGTIDKYMGDCIMAFWNAPFDDARHAHHGCEAALAMMAQLEPLNRRLREDAEAAGRPFQPLSIGIGVNTGECVVGNMGSEQRFDYSVLGDAVNLASRLEGLSRVYGLSIVVGEDTRAAAPDFAALELDLIAVKGKTEAVRVYTLLGDATMRDSDAFRRRVATQQAMLTAYRARQWDRAEALLAEIAESHADFADYCAEYRRRVAIHRANPPGPDWDGAEVAEKK